MKLSLYHYAGCPFCHRVWDAAEQIGVSMEELDIHRVPAHRQALVERMGRATVPVLRIEHDDGRVEMLPESRDIVRYLRDHFG